MQPAAPAVTPPSSTASRGAVMIASAKQRSVGGARTARGSAAFSRGAVIIAFAGAGVVACAAPARLTPGPAATVFVASGREGTAYRLDPATGHALGPPLPVPGSPRQLAPAPGGGLVVFSVTQERTCNLTHFAAPRASGEAWAAHSLTSVLAPSAPCTQVLLAGDGRRYVAVAAPTARDPLSSASACQLHVLDLLGPTPRNRPVTREITPCSPGTVVTALASADGPDGPVVYAGLWWGAAPGRWTGHGAVLAIDPATGAVLGRIELTGAPERLVPAAATGDAGQRLYIVEGSPGPDKRNPGIVGDPPTHWRLLTLDPVSLTVTAAVPLPADADDAPPMIAVTPSGARLFVLVRAAGRRSALRTLDLTTGAAEPVILLPGEALGGLLATHERVYVPDSLGRGIWVVNHRQGHLLNAVDAVDAGRGAVAIALSPPL